MHGIINLISWVRFPSFFTICSPIFCSLKFMYICWNLVSTQFSPFFRTCFIHWRRSKVQNTCCRLAFWQKFENFVSKEPVYWLKNCLNFPKEQFCKIDLLAFMFAFKITLRFFRSLGRKWNDISVHFWLMLNLCNYSIYSSFIILRLLSPQNLSLHISLL